MNKTTTDLRTISEFFTDAEWEAISSAMSDFSDYGNEESEIANNIQSKIYHLFAAVNWDYESKKRTRQFDSIHLQTRKFNFINGNPPFTI